MRHRSRTHHAFTLIELLAVIGIIALLVALLFPAIKSSLIKGEVVKAQSGIANLQTAFKAYYTEYGKWPVTDTQAGNSYIVDQNFVGVLQGGNPTLSGGASTVSGYPYGTTSGNFQTIGTANFLNANPRGIHFLDFKASDLDPGGAFIDPWKRPYYVRFDVSYQNQVEDPFSENTSKTNLTGGFVIWSNGPDNQYDGNGDSFPAPVGPISAYNADNVKSW